jgi:tetratricopeptide (TPR) repeat protein
MSTKKIALVKISITGLLTQLLLVALLTYLFSIAGIDMPFLWAALLYALMAKVLRSTVAKQHRKGLVLLQKGQYQYALPCFEASVHFFTTYRWVDQCRALTLLNATGNSYRETGLCLIATCNAQIGNIKAAKEQCEKILAEYPDSGRALVGLQKLMADRGEPNSSTLL